MATFGSENRGTTRCGNHEGLLSAQGWWHTSLLGRRCLGWWGRGRVGPVAQRATPCSQWLCVCCSIGRWCCRDLGWSTTRWLGKGDSGSSEGWATEYDWTLLLRMGVFCWKGLPWKFHKFTCNSFNCKNQSKFYDFQIDLATEAFFLSVKSSKLIRTHRFEKTLCEIISNIHLQTFWKTPTPLPFQHFGFLFHGLYFHWKKICCLKAAASNRPFRWRLSRWCWRCSDHFQQWCICALKTWWLRDGFGRCGRWWRLQRGTGDVFHANLESTYQPVWSI